MPELISCIVPVFNCERYLGEAIDSLLAQTYRPIEIVVANDGSTDGTAAVIERYGSAVRSVTQPNAGPASACNLGLTAATGEFVAFLGADDLFHPEKLTRQMARFEARPELDLSVGFIQNFWAPEMAAEAEQLKDTRLARPIPGYSVATLLTRRKMFDKVGSFNDTLQHGIDLDWFLRAAELGAVTELVQDVLVFRRLHESNRSRARASQSHDTFLQILKRSLDHRRQRHEGQTPAYEFPDAVMTDPD